MNSPTTAAASLAFVLHDHALMINRLNKLVTPLDDARLAEQPHGQVNHPAWTLGHLALVLDHGCMLVGGESVFDATWGARHGGGSQPTTNRADYPTKAVLLEALNAQSQRLGVALAACAATALESPNPIERARGRFPAIGEFLVHMLTSEPSYHLGQLTGWCRAMGWTVKF